jgi:hypothetical protein
MSRTFAADSFKYDAALFTGDAAAAKVRAGDADRDELRRKYRFWAGEEARGMRCVAALKSGTASRASGTGTEK